MGEGGRDSERVLGKHDALGFPGDWHLHASLVLLLPRILSLAAPTGREAPLQSPAAPRCLQEHQQDLQHICAPLPKHLILLLVREGICSLPESTRANTLLFAEALTQVLKASVHLGAEMGTFEPGTFLTWRMPPATAACTPPSPCARAGMCCPRLGNQHMLQIPAPQARPCCRVSCPLPSPPLPHREKMQLGEFSVQNQLPGTS